MHESLGMERNENRMAQRTVALYEGQYIGIETIYTVIAGQQINIPDKLKELREKSQSNQLFCPCGCGANLILVAGDRNLREQHFRLKDGQCRQECYMVTEGKTSVNSKIVLKCWLDAKIAAGDLASRVAIHDIADVNRKYEFTFLSRNKGIAISYAHEKRNLSDEKFEILEANGRGIRIIYITDYMNGGTNGQFPEAMMKIQKRQGFCLLLCIKDADYYKAEMRAVYYAQDINGFWEEIELTKGMVSEYSIDSVGHVVYGTQTIESILTKSVAENHARLDHIKKQRMIKEQERIEYLKRLQAKEEEEQLSLQKQQEREEAARQKHEEEFKKALEADEPQQETPIFDGEHNRWIQCKFCRQWKMEREFVSYGGVGSVNLGTCKECSINNPEVKKRFAQKAGVKKEHDPNKCPQCGSGNLQEKNGPYGRFLGCSNYPKCRYTRRLR